MNNELATKAEELSKTLQLRDKETRQVVEAFKKEVNQKVNMLLDKWISNQLPIVTILVS